MNNKRVVAEGYDRIAEGYLRWRLSGVVERHFEYVRRLIEGLPPDARVLDAGCGAGEPYTCTLAASCDTVGVDISGGQLALARRALPAVAFARADMCALPFRAGAFDAITALYSIIHVDRTEHEALLRDLHRLLRPGGRLLAVLGAREWEGTEDNWLGLGATLFWSHFGAEENLELLRRAGFRLIESSREPDVEGGEHLFVLAEKPG